MQDDQEPALEGLGARAMATLRPKAKKEALHDLGKRLAKKEKEDEAKR